MSNLRSIIRRKQPAQTYSFLLVTHYLLPFILYFIIDTLRRISLL
jgi:hypothetical protein